MLREDLQDPQKYTSESNLPVRGYKTSQNGHGTPANGTHTQKYLPVQIVHLAKQSCNKKILDKIGEACVGGVLRG